MVEAARELAGTFFEKKRPDDSTVIDTRNESANHLMRFAQGPLFSLIDDTRCDLMLRVLDAIAELPDDVQPDLAYNEAMMHAHQAGDVMTHDLTGWLHSDTRRCVYLEEVLRHTEFGSEVQAWEILAEAQGAELDEVFQRVVDWLHYHVKRIELIIVNDEYGEMEGVVFCKRRPAKASRLPMVRQLTGVCRADRR
jgi:hypothetical protein